MRKYPEVSGCIKMAEKRGDWILLFLDGLKEYCWFAVSSYFMATFFCCIFIDPFLIRLFPYHVFTASKIAIFERMKEIFL